MKYDVVIVGSGIAGLFTALRCSQRGLSVLVVTKSRIKSSSTNWAQGGIAAVLDPADEMAIEAHVQDTISSGKGLCDESVVRSVVVEAAQRIADLVNFGVRFDGDSHNYHKAIEGGHSEPRILHSKDRTGAEIEQALELAATSEGFGGLKINEDWMAIDLVQSK
ncbi:MAG: FAD-dependent oxidoreductase, partial [Candidatus Thermoplasmatota archaeon]|nr:FAD-dependent oxidoreductase [Candidatus Thermoplasmatota archaeon]